MDYSTKISLTIYLEGSVLVRKNEKEFIPYIVRERDLDVHKKWKGNDGLKVIRKGVIPHYPKEVKPATQHTNITGVAYEEMTSKEAPYWFTNPKLWERLSKKHKLELHLQRMCSYLGGESFSYEILED